MAPEDTVEYGPSTSNRIERWWRELRERLGKFFKFQLPQLLEQGFYDREDEDDRKILAYVFIPIVQRELDLFVDLWNNSRTRLQRNTLMPDGIPNVIMILLNNMVWKIKVGILVGKSLLKQLRHLVFLMYWMIMWMKLSELSVCVTYLMLKVSMPKMLPGNIWN